MWIISVGNDVALVRSIIHALAQCVGRTELEPGREATIPSYLKGVVPRTRHVVRLPDRAVSQIRSNGVEISGWVRRPNRRGWLVDVCFSLKVQATTAHVCDRGGGPPRQFPLHCEIPVPGFRIPEVLTLGSHYQRYGCGSGASGIVRRTQRCAGIWLKWRIAAQKN